MQDCPGNSDKIEKLAHEKLKLHSAYLIGMLIMIIITLATVAWTPQAKFTEYLSNAATFVSVVLGLVAIFYSFVSNDSLSKSLGSISSVTEQIGKTREQMATYVSRTADITKSAADGVAVMRTASSEMNSSFIELSDLLKNIQTRTGEFHEILGQLPVRFDKLELALQTKSKHEATETVGTDDQLAALPPIVVEQFIESSNLIINGVCYAITKAYSKGQKIQLSDLGEIFGVKATLYFVGIVQVIEGVGLAVLSTEDSVRAERSVIDVDQTLLSKIGPYLESYIETEFSDSPDKRKQWDKIIKDIDGLFEER